jgi:hypothetical protein
LSVWQATLTRQAESLRAEIRARQTDLAQVEERLSLVTKLIEVETRALAGHPETMGEAAPAAGAARPAQSAREASPDLEDAVEEILRASGEPLHISKIREALVARGAPIPGRGDDANIIVRLRRSDDRFTRTARGTYGLSEWGIPPLASKTRKSRRKRPR